MEASQARDSRAENGAAEAEEEEGEEEGGGGRKPRSNLSGRTDGARLASPQE